MRKPSPFTFNAQQYGVELRFPNPPPVEPEPMLKEIPMTTADGVDITHNSILYRVHWETGYDFKKEGKGEVEALRVFYVSNAARQFRAKCIKGCEEIFKFNDGCSSRKLFGKLPAAIEELNSKIDEDLRACERKIIKVHDTQAAILQERKRVNKLRVGDVREPKAVK